MQVIFQSHAEVTIRDFPVPKCPVIEPSIPNNVLIVVIARFGCIDSEIIISSLVYVRHLAVLLVILQVSSLSAEFLLSSLPNFKFQTNTIFSYNFH